MEVLDKPRKPSYAASSAERWLVCPASVDLCRHVAREPSNIYAKEGTAAHYLAAKCIEEETTADRFIDEELTCEIYYEDPYTFKVSHDMAFAVNRYFQFVNSLRGADKTTEVFTEKQIALASVEGGLRGVADLIALQRNGKALVIADYKHGKGILVDAENNAQMAFYACAVLEEMEHFRNIQIRDFESLDIYIIQPRAFFGPTIKRWEIDDPADFYEEWQQKFKVAYRQTKNKIQPYGTGPGCRWCAGLVLCPHLRKIVRGLAKGVKVEDLTNRQLSDLLKQSGPVRQYLEAVEAHASARLEEGDKIPGFKIVSSGRGTRGWIDEEKAREFLTEELLLEETEVMIHQLKSPAEIEKMIGAKGKKKIGKMISTKRKDGIAVVPKKDKRPAITTPENDFAELFE